MGESSREDPMEYVLWTVAGLIVAYVLVRIALAYLFKKDRYNG